MAIIPRALRAAGACLALALTVAACPSDPVTQDTCPSGTEGCACYGNQTCSGELACVDGLCAPSTCTAGSDGCPCFGNGTCAAGLVCNAEATCEAEVCEPGTVGCPCFGNGTCGGALSCESDVCVEVPCDGQLGCACLTDGSCDAGLRCDAATCVACPAGTLGCACDAGTCGTDLACSGAVCTSCPAGTLGCACFGASGLCGDHLGAELECASGLCELVACPRGSEGCLCNKDGGCDLGLSCSGTSPTSTCEVPAACPVGTEGCPCDLVTGCDAGLYCDSANVCTALNCTVGQLDCTCAANGTCLGDGVVCNADGWCEQAVCPDGSEGCPCATSGEACGVNTRGEAMTCGTEGLCEAPSCIPGDQGCPCAWGAECTGASDVCVAGFCKPAGCAPGTLNCGCTSGLCGAKLSCRDGAVCVDNTGYLDGPCDADGSCAFGMACASGTSTCQTCQLGTLGCDCEAGVCTTGLACYKDHCVDPAVTPIPPVNPVCYSHCERDFVTAAGDFVQCDADELVEGCFDGLQCDVATCVTPGNTAPTCDTELDCKAWQTCIDGGCYSQCTTDSECNGGQECVLRVCRTPCTTEQTGTCGTGYSCLTQDGQVGHCYRVAAPGDGDQTEVYASFDVAASEDELTNVLTTTTLGIVNNSPATETFTVRKLGHTLYESDGSNEVQLDPDGDGVDCDPLQDCPLVWLAIGPTGQEAPVQELTVTVPGDGGSVAINVLNADGGPSPRWVGRFEVVHETFGVRTVTIQYTERPEGRWNGKAYYFATFGEDGLAEWAVDNQTKNDQALIDGVGNALVRQWAAFRLGDIDLDNFEAVLKATRHESWRWSTVQQDCPVPNGACYPYDINQLGLVTYTSNVESNPIPTGVVELPMSINLRLDVNQTGLLTGKIDSDRSLQYAGNPSITLDFGSDPSGCDTITGGACLVFMESLDAEIFVGGRYASDSGDTSCANRPAGYYDNRQIPWLLADFTGDTEKAGDTGYLYKYECRDTFLPFNDGPASDLTDAQATANTSLSLSNPIPDGRTRRRTINLIDGALINQTTMFILFEEVYASFLPDPTATFSAYGYMLLERDPEELDQSSLDGDLVPDVYQGSMPQDARPEPTTLLDVQCTDALLLAAIDTTTVTSANAAFLVETLISGSKPSTPCTAGQACHDGACCDQVCDSFDCTYSNCASTCGDELLGAGDSEQVHYLCHDTGLFDGGPGAQTPPFATIVSNNNCDGAPFLANNGVCDDGGPDAETSICPLGTDKNDCGPRKAADIDSREPCPAGSGVTYFTLQGVTQQDIADLDCQQDGSCEDVFAQWKVDGSLTQIDPLWRCEDTSVVYCDDDRYDLRTGKIFYAASNPDVVFPSLHGEIELAFRYKTRFQARDGSSPGFAPQVCIPDSNQIPYCYDPVAIEKLRDRVDCLLSVWTNHYDAVTNDPGPLNTKKSLDDFLCANFSYKEACEPVGPTSGAVHDGFERLYSELLVMLGDDAYTSAFASRFDLVGQNTVSFEGTLFEDGGIDLSGAAGYEMYSLYKGAQYYQMVLDRFYAMSPALWEALGYTTAARNFVSQETVTRYFERLIRASTQKARTWSEVAKRYQAFNEVGLAKRVVQRAYTATYIENIVLSQLMLTIIEALAPEARPQIVAALEQGQRRYRMALLDMQNVYAALGGEVRYFGLEPDYIPFPTVQDNGPNAFEVLLTRAKQKMETARYREDQAIERSKAFESDEASFQSELVNLRNTYENQLGDLCGTFEGEDGKIYPAITRYAQLSGGLATFGDPCGMAGHGAIHDALVQIDIQQLEMEKIRASYDRVIEDVNIEKSRVEAQCNLTLKLADYQYKIAGKVQNFNIGILTAQQALSAIDRTLSYSSAAAQLTKCSTGPGGTDCPQGVAALVHMTSTYAAGNVAALAVETGIKIAQGELAELEAESAKWQTETQCDAALIDSNARMASMVLQLKEIQLEALRADYAMRLRFSDIAELKNKAKRLEDEYAEAQQMSVNVAAAHNDPNVRIYRDDAIVNAEVAFEDAIREAYKATRVYEYYTSQSYGALEQLFLIRMVQYGDYNLQNYLSDLDNAFFEFGEQFGLPDARVALVSLRDDMLAIPWTADDGTALTQSQRITMMREALLDPARLDDNGYLTIPFRTDLETLSPLTRNHKVTYMEAELIGSDVGDTIGRVYVRQKGTATISGLDDDKDFYRFPLRTAVINPFFNGNRFFDPVVYRNYHLRDRPLVNTSWELVVNQRDELANQDIDLQSLTDMRLFIYYTDFTPQ